MWLALAWLTSVAVGGWLGLEVAFTGARGRRGSIPLAVLGMAAACWAGAELLLLDADAPGEILFGRRLLYTGACFLPAAWLSVSLRAAGPAWLEHRPGWLALLYLPPAFFYSFLYWDDSGLFLSVTSETPFHHGPLWPVFSWIQWAYTAVGIFAFIRAGVRLGRSDLRLTAALLVAVATPLLANVLYGTGVWSTDITAALLGPTGLILRVTLLDTGLALYVPVARDEVVEQLEVGVVVAGLDGRVVEANRAAQGLTGTASLQSLFLDDVEQAARARVGRGVEARRIDLHGRLGLAGHALLLVDRSEAEEARRRLELAGRLEALGSLTAGIAHEVNNPLAFVQANLVELDAVTKEIGAAASAAADAAGAPRAFDAPLGEASELIDETRGGVQRIALLVRRLTSFAREPDGEAEARWVDLGAVCRQAIQVAGIGLAPDAIAFRPLPPEARRVFSVEQALFQILVNLLLNAVQASEETPEVELEVALAGEELRLAVRDRGPGIPECMRDRVFDPFFTTKAQGTGLGLSLSFDLARRLGGRLEAHGRDGGGSELRLVLPRSDPGARDRPA